MVTLGISRVTNTNEYRVFWFKDGRNVEAKTYYTDDAEDAVNTLITTLEQNPSETRMSEAKYTLSLVAKYRPDFLLSETRETIFGNHEIDSII